MNGLEERTANTVAQPLWSEDEFADLVRMATEEHAPKMFAIVEEYGEREACRVAGYGLAYPDRADVDSVEGGFHLISQSAERARQLFELSASSRGVRTRLVWLTGAPNAEEG